ncbi:MAG: hypothetical protein DCE90_18210 [Pseudanabaena sp.]|nr:MAG: hypothetical protein DCE90_18210 [Pseudanabaena sp.]
MNYEEVNKKILINNSIQASVEAIIFSASTSNLKSFYFISDLLDRMPHYVNECSDVMLKSQDVKTLYHLISCELSKRKDGELPWLLDEFYGMFNVSSPDKVKGFSQPYDYEDYVDTYEEVEEILVNEFRKKFYPYS